MNCKSVVLSQGSQAQKSTCWRIPFTGNSRIGKIICGEKHQISGCLWGGGGKGMRELSGVMTTFCILMEVSVTRVCMYLFKLSIRKFEIC